MTKEERTEAFTMVMDFWRRIGSEDTSPTPNWQTREMAHAKRLIKIGLTKDDVLNIVEWRIQNDNDGFWGKRLHSLGTIYSHLSDWAVEARTLPKSFEDFLDKHPDLDYRKLEIKDDKTAYIKASICKQAIEQAKKSGVVLTSKDFETLYKASKIKVDVFKKEKS